MPRMWLGLALCILITPLAAADSSKLSTAEQTRRAIEAHERGDGDALAALANDDYTRRWIVAFNAVLKGKPEAALAFAKACKLSDDATLLKRVTEWTDAPLEGPVLDAYLAMREAIRGQDYRAAVAAVSDLLIPDGLLRMDAYLVLYYRASLERALGKPLAALSSAEQTATLARRMGHTRGLRDALQLVAGLAELLNKHPRGIEAWQELRKLFVACGDEDNAAIALSNCGRLLHAAGRIADARRSFERAIAEMRRLENTRSLAYDMLNYGLLLRDVGEDSRAVECFRESLTKARALGIRGLVVSALGNLGNVACEQGDLARAAELHDEALAGARKLGDPMRLAEVLGNQAAIYMRTSEWKRAEKLLTECIALFERLGDPRRAALYLGNLAVVKGESGRLQEAMETERRVLAIKERLGDKVGAALTRNNIAVHLMDLKRYDEAQKLFDEVLLERERLGDTRGALVTKLNIAQLLGHLERHKESFAQYEAVRSEFEELGLALELIWVNWGISLAAHRLNRFADALAAARRGIALIHRGAHAQVDTQAASMRDQFRQLFENGFIAAMDLQDMEACLELVEHGRASSLLQTLGGLSRVRRATVKPALLARIRAAETALAEAQAEVSAARLEGRRKAVRAKRAVVERRRADVETARESIIRSTRLAADLGSPKPASLREIQACLAPGDTLVLYVYYSTDAGALIIRKDTAKHVRLGLKEEIDQACEAVKLDDPEEDPQAALTALRKQLVEPLGLGEETTSLLVSPTDALGRIPFGLLWDRGPVVYVPSATTMAYLAKEEVDPGTKSLALGDPVYSGSSNPRSRTLPRLLGTAAEAKSVGDVVLLRERASVPALQEAAAKEPRWRAVHFACHGLLDEERPLRSALALSAKAPDDGMLEVSEILRMSLPADLVTLSACESGRGRHYGAEGTIGLTRAFMQAGASRVLVSLWKVDDAATRLLMERFYAAWLKDGLAPSAALRRAQKEVRELEVEVVDREASRAEGRTVHKLKRRYAHPYYWAAWVLWGLPR